MEGHGDIAFFPTPVVPICRLPNFWLVLKECIVQQTVTPLLDVHLLFHSSESEKCWKELQAYMMWMVHSVTYKAEHPKNSRSNSFGTSKLRCRLKMWRQNYMPIVICTKQELQRGMHERATSQQIYLYCISCSEHHIAWYIYIMYGAKGLRNTNVVLMVNHIWIMRAKNTHTHIPRIHKCCKKTVRCRTSHKYTNILNFYSAKYYNHLQNSIIDHICTYKIHLQNKRSVCLSIS